jgi:hypothetical protein
VKYEWSKTVRIKLDMDPLQPLLYLSLLLDNLGAYKLDGLHAFMVG